jgi:predicted metalloprotease with PDZ domain
VRVRYVADDLERVTQRGLVDRHAETQHIERAAPALRDASVYPLFYQQGATFFAELDRTLQEATRGERSLDDFVPKIRSNEDGTLPEDLIVAWRAVAGDAVDKLVARYVGQ